MARTRRVSEGQLGNFVTKGYSDMDSTDLDIIKSIFRGLAGKYEFGFVIGFGKTYSGEKCVDVVVRMDGLAGEHRSSGRRGKRTVDFKGEVDFTFHKCVGRLEKTPLTYEPGEATQYDMWVSAPGSRGRDYRKRVSASYAYEPDGHFDYNTDLAEMQIEKALQSVLSDTRDTW